MHVIDIDDLHKRFDGAPVLQGLSLRLPAGMVYGLLGPNGAGKTTLIHLLLGYLRPDRGNLRVLGETDLQRIDGRVGYLPERLRYHTRYTAREYLGYLGQFGGLGGRDLAARIERELAAVGLGEVADRTLSTFSRGMLQRLGIAQALLSDPDLLLIDEPTSGLDPGGQHDVLALLDDLRGRGRTILMATHYLDEAELLCDRVGVLHEGVIAAEAEVRTLRATSGSVAIGVRLLPPELVPQLEALGPAVRCASDTVTIAPHTDALQAQVLRLLLDASVPIESLAPVGRPLEDLYLRVVRGEPVLPTPAPAHAGNGVAPEAAAAPITRPLPRDEAPPRPGPSGTGDTLLRELLRREERGGDDG